MKNITIRFWGWLNTNTVRSVLVPYYKLNDLTGPEMTSPKGNNLKKLFHTSLMNKYMLLGLNFILLIVSLWRWKF